MIGLPSKKPRSSRLMEIRSGRMPLTQNDLKEHVWLCTALAKGEPTEELQEKGFNYFSQDAQGRLVAYKLVMLR